jgi:outer membrane protein assembly factor BamB
VRSGRQNWGKVQPDGPVAASPLVMDDKVIVVTESGAVYAFNSEGADAWPRAYETNGKIYTSAVAAADLILVAPYQANFLLAALDSDGKQAWLFGQTAE